MNGNEWIYELNKWMDVLNEYMWNKEMNGKMNKWISEWMNE